MKIDLEKYRGLGYEYVIYDPNKINVEINKEIIKKICYINSGANIDGILYGPILVDGKLELVIYNIEGFEVKINLNAVRVFARYLIDKSYVKENKILITHCNREIEVNLLDEFFECYKLQLNHNIKGESEITTMDQCEEILNSVYMYGPVKQVGNIIIYL